MDQTANKLEWWSQLVNIQDATGMEWWTEWTSNGDALGITADHADDCIEINSDSDLAARLAGHQANLRIVLVAIGISKSLISPWIH